jgi:SAM-dependent methyltransferase
MTVHNTSDDARQRWDERYANKGSVFGAEPNRFVAEHVAGLSPSRVLDLGSGQGRNAVWLALQGHTVTAVDLSQVATEQAREFAAEAGVDAYFIAADLLTWEPEPESFDLVLLSYLQLPKAARQTVHAMALRSLAPGGTVFLIAHHRANLERGVGGPPSPEVLFTEEEIGADFADCEIVRLEEVLRPVDVDGEKHEAIDVLLIARKPVG